MEFANHVRIADDLITELEGRGIAAFKRASASGSVYVYVVGSLQKIRIADHGKHCGWFRYNIRTDLKRSREFMYAGQKIFLFVETDLRKAVYRVAKDFKDSRRKNAIAIVKQAKREHGKRRAPDKIQKNTR